MANTHILTAKETKAIADAVSVIKKFGKYIEQVNTTNWCLQDNLDKAIKAGDVTNAQKVYLRIYGETQRLWDNLHANLVRTCRVGCKCAEEDKEKCASWESFLIVDSMYRFLHGEEMAWEEVFWRMSQTTRKDYLNATRNRQVAHCCRG